MVSTKPTERQIQIAIVEWIHTCTDLPVIKIDNEGKRSVFMGRLAKAMGLYPGACDLLIARPTKDYPGLWIEVKRSSKEKPRKNQIDFINRMILEGYKAVCVWDIENTIALIKSHYGDDLWRFKR